MSDSTSRVPRRTALESAFPSAMLSQVGTQESWRKEVHRPATSTHKWWAKRLGTVFRGILTSALTGEHDDAAKAYASAQSYRDIVVLDPFAGSGTTGVEAVKLGMTAVSFDINPVATLVQRQALESWDLAALKAAYSAVEAACRAEVDRVHLTEDGRTVLYYFWVATVSCTVCDDPVYLFDSTVYSKNAYAKKKPKAQLVCPVCLDVQEGRYDFQSATCGNGHVFTQQGNVVKSVARCGNGHGFKVREALGDEPPHYEMYAKMVGDGRRGKTYEPINDWDRKLYADCKQHVEDLPASVVLPSGQLAAGNNTDQALNWNFRHWRQFFNARQLYSLSLMATAIRDLPGNGPEREALCALFSGTLEFNNLFTSFKGEGTGAVRHMFSNHILKPERTPLEAHPWGTSQSSGAFSQLFSSRLLRAYEYKTDPVDLVMQPDGTVGRVSAISMPLSSPIQQDWTSLAASGGAYVATRNAADTDIPSGSVDLVVTDPPYMDNVHYAELADFFHAWLKEMRPYPSYLIGETTRQVGEVQHADPAEFGKAIEAVWAECERVLKPGGLLAFTFHQARIGGWARLIEALDHAGFVVTAIQPVKGEMTTSIVKAGASEPSNLDSVVVCRRRTDGAERPFQTVDQAVETTTRNLVALRDTGVDVGKGDVRSVLRGTLLAHLVGEGEQLDAQLELVDKLASTAIDEIFSVQTLSAPGEDAPL